MNPPAPTPLNEKQLDLMTAIEGRTLWARSKNIGTPTKLDKLTIECVQGGQEKFAERIEKIHRWLQKSRQDVQNVIAKTRAEKERALNVHSWEYEMSIYGKIEQAASDSIRLIEEFNKE